MFLSVRPDPESVEEVDDDAPAQLMMIGPAGGEARVLGTRPGGLSDVMTASYAGIIVALSLTLPGSSPDDDAARREQRKTGKINAVLHDGYPVRYWDDDLGPHQPRLVAAATAAPCKNAQTGPPSDWSGAT